MIRVRSVTSADADAWCEMRHALWADDTLEEHQAAIKRYFAGHRREPKEVLLALDGSGVAVGFVELSIRNIVDSCVTDRVAYLEGWYVRPGARRQGVGRELIRAAEQWGVEQGCIEFGSDALLENEVSLAAHLALGFEDTGRVRNFRKDLPRPNAAT